MIVLRSNTLGFIDVKVPIDAEVEGYVESLRKTGKYETVEYNTIGKYHFIPNDNYISNQWYLNTINAYDSWDITCGNPEISVAIIDSGVDTNHSDLGFGSDGYTNLDVINGWNYELNNNTLITI